MIVEFSESDVLGSKLVTPNWYEVLIERIEDKASSDGKSINAWIKGKIVKNADTGSTDFQGVPTPFNWLINSKAAFGLTPILRAIGIEPKPGDRADVEAIAGKRFEMFIGNGINPKNQQMQNIQTGQFRPLRETVSS